MIQKLQGQSTVQMLQLSVNENSHSQITLSHENCTRKVQSWNDAWKLTKN